MKHSKTFVMAAILVATLFSCKKENEPKELASLNVVNAAINVPAFKVKYWNGSIVYSTATDQINYSASKVYRVDANTEVPLVVVPSSDTTTKIYDSKIKANAGEIYSLFVFGQSAPYESILIRESLPRFYYSDSVAGIRIINLSPNSTPVNITLASTTTTNVFTNVAYKQITDFVKFPMPTTTPANTITFQARNAGGALLASYVIPTTAAGAYPGISVALSRFRNLTLVVKGLQGTTTGSNAFGLFPVANY